MTFDPEEFGSEGPVVRDKRRIDPVTGELREPRDPAAPGVTRSSPVPAGRATSGTSGVSDVSETSGDAPGSDAEAALAALAERTTDLQRLQAEYINYKRRVDRDREVMRSAAVASTLAAMLPVLDDIGRAREHGELTGGFKAVAESLERVVSGLGLTAFGQVGDDFDPRIHEALMHTYSDDVDRPVCQAVLQVGYRFGDRVVRPARVAVAEPEHVSVEAFGPDDVPEVDESTYPESGSGPAGSSYDQASTPEQSTRRE